MGTQTEIPEIKLANVGKQRRRKGGGAAWLGGARAGSGFAGLGGGLCPSIGLIAAMVIAGPGAALLGQIRHHSRLTGGAPPKIFADKSAPKYDDLPGVVAGDNSRPNSLGYVSGSLDGMTPEERARKQAEEEAARKAEEDAKKKADEDAAKQAETSPSAPAQAAGPAHGGFGSHFGKLSSSFGGGLSGGSGMSGGIGRSFGGMGGGMGGKGANGANGAMSAFKMPAAPGQGKATPRAHGAGKGFAMAQLRGTNAASRTGAVSPTAEGAASAASTPFDALGNGGTAIDGPGVGNGLQGGAGSGGTPLNPNSNNTGDCPAGQYMGSSGTCQNVNSNTLTNAVPYQDELNAAQDIMYLIMGLSATALVLSQLGWYGKIAAYIICGLIALAGLALAGIGIHIMTTYGNALQGGILTACGVL